MTTTTVFGDASDGFIYYDDASYANASTGVGGGGTAIDTTGTLIYAGAIPDVIEVLMAFLSFDTAGVPDAEVVSAVVLSLWGEQDNYVVDVTLEARDFDWSSGGLTAADWRTPTQLSALNLLASFPTTSFSISAYMDFTSQAAFNNYINKTGLTYFVLSTDHHRTATAPTSAPNGEYGSMWSADNTGTTNDPKLVITSAAAPSGQPTGKRWGGIPFAGGGQPGRW